MAIEWTTLASATPASGDKIIFRDVSEDPDELKECTLSDLAGVVGGGSAASTTEVLTGTDSSKVVTPDTLAALWEAGSDIASSSTISVGEGGQFNITGTTTITDIDFGTDKAGRTVWFKFAGALTLTHNATTLILLGGANITTAAGDIACFRSEGSDNVRMLAYFRANGQALLANPQFTTVELGHASDTTLSRSAAGVLAVEGVDQVSVSGAQTLTNKKYALNAALGTDDTYEGITITGKNAAGTIAQWEPVYLASNGKWTASDAESPATMPARGLTVAAGTADNPVTVLTYGIVRNDAWNWTVGGTIYVNGGGGLVQTPPPGSGDTVQAVGYAISADIAFFDFNSTVIEIA